MVAMRQMKDKYFDLAIVDPPYGIGKRMVDGGNSMNKYKDSYHTKEWDVAPGPEYFDELRRVSKHQVIWGGNYFPLPPTRGIICWDKKNFMPSFSRWEMAWTSFDCVARIYYHRSSCKDRTHPTEKPVELYEWVLENYAKQGDKILDTHLGSGSSAIAARNMNFDFTGYEIDSEYFDKAKKWIDNTNAQGRLL